jgi:hypothetical protein
LPSLKRIFGCLDVPVRFFHNDAPGLVCAPFLGEIGVNVLYAETGNIGENDVMLLLHRRPSSSVSVCRRMSPRAVWPKKLSAQPHSMPGLFDAFEEGGPNVTIVAGQADGYSAELERTFFMDRFPMPPENPLGR